MTEHNKQTTSQWRNNLNGWLGILALLLGSLVALGGATLAIGGRWFVRTEPFEALQERVRNNGDRMERRIVVDSLTLSQIGVDTKETKEMVKQLFKRKEK